MPRSPLASSTKLPGGYRPVARSKAPPTSSGTPPAPRQASRAACTGDIGARVRRRLILAVKMSARRSSRASWRSSGSSASGSWASPRVVVQAHRLAPQRIVHAGVAQQLRALRRMLLDLLAHGRGERARRCRPAGPASVAMATFMLSAAQPRLRTDSLGPAEHRRRLLAHQHDQQRMVAAVLFQRVPGGMDQVVQRRIHLALAQLAGALVHQAHAGDEFGARAARRAAPCRAARSGFPTGRARWRRPPLTVARALSCSRASAMAFSGAFWRSITPMAAPELAPPFVGFVLVGKQRPASAAAPAARRW